MQVVNGITTINTAVAAAALQTGPQQDRKQYHSNAGHNFPPGGAGHPERHGTLGLRSDSFRGRAPGSGAFAMDCRECRGVASQNRRG